MNSQEMAAELGTGLLSFPVTTFDQRGRLDAVGIA
jgi:hypothetical protein